MSGSSLFSTFGNTCRDCQSLEERFWKSRAVGATHARALPFSMRKLKPGNGSSAVVRASVVNFPGNPCLIKALGQAREPVAPGPSGLPC